MATKKLYIYQKSLFLVLFLFFSLCVQAQKVQISGNVIDKKTSQPIPGANVYLSDTVVGASTELDGSYSFSTELKGSYTLVVTFIGYTSASMVILLEKGFNPTINFELNENTFELDEIEVTGSSNTEWAMQLSQFKDFFLGTDDFAKKTFIQNPEVINFEKKGSGVALSVTSLKPVIINNHALGYKIIVEFSDIVFDPIKKTGSYVVYPRFTEMEPNNRREQRAWEDNREKSYRGSSRHFFKSLVEDKVRTNKFTIFPDRNVIEESKDPRMIQSLYGSNWRDVFRNYYSFLVTDMSLAIGYNLIVDRGGNPDDINELSNIDIEGTYNLIIINEQGLLYDPSSVELKGKWGRDRFAKHLPLSYSF